jgi:hypothetical protein
MLPFRFGVYAKTPPPPSSTPGRFGPAPGGEDDGDGLLG